MRLADWLVLAEGIEEADYIPLAPVNYEPACDTGRVKCRPDREMKVASTVAPVAKSPTDYPVGTKLKWRHATNPETYRVAIMTKHGPLQVKSLTDGGADCCFVTKYSYRGKLMTVRRLKKTLFKTTQDWFDSLPEGGYKSVERK
jgi:hypothetical protein